MKTNKILMAMVLAAGFTACTSEDVVESTQTNALENRKVLGDIEFVMGGVDSRFALENLDWILEEGDAFGAVLVDAPNGKKSENAWENYTLTSYIQTNYRYAKGEGKVFTTPARMVEGNYVFYAPYNEKHLTRKPMETVFPITQTLDVVKGEVLPFSPVNNALKEGYPFFVDYKFLSAEDQESNLTINFKHLYSYPEIKFVNDSEEDIDIEKFVINLGDETIHTKGTLYIAKDQAGVASSAASGIVGNLFNLGTELKEETGAAAEGKQDWGAWVDYNVAKKSGLIEGKTSDLIKGEGAKTNVITIEIPEGLTVKAGEEIAFCAVLPAETFTDITVVAVVDSKEGYKSAKVNEQFLSGKRYPYGDYVPSTGKLKAANKVGKDMALEIEDADDDLASVKSLIVAPVVVTTPTEFVKAIDAAKDALAIIAEGEAVYNATVAAALADSDVKGALTILSDLTIEGAATAAKAISLDEFESIEGNVTVKSGYVKGTDLETKLIVEEGAYFTVSGTIAELENNGKVTLAKGAVVTKALNNEDATIKVGADGATITEIVNKGTVEVGGQLTTTEAKFSNFEAADAEKDIEGYCGTVKVTGEYTNDFAALKGDWDVSGTLTVSKNVSVEKSLDIDATGVLDGDTKTVTINDATVNVYGTISNNITIEMNGSDDTTEADNNVDAALNLKEGAQIMGVIKAATAVTDAKWNQMTVEEGVYFLKDQTLGKIISTYTHEGNIVDTTKDLAFVPGKGVVNKVKINGNFQITDQGLNLSASTAGWTGITALEVNNVYVADKDLNLKFPEVKVGGNIIVNAGKILRFNYAGASVEVVGTITNEGTLKMDDPTTIKLGKVVSASNIAMTAVTNLTLNGNINLNDNAQITLGAAAAVHVENNVTITGAGDNTNKVALKTNAATTVNIYSGKKLTIAANTNIDGSVAQQITFVSNAQANAATAAVSGAVGGTVENKGGVYAAKEAYEQAAAGATADNGAKKLWWKGTTAVTAVK